MISAIIYSQMEGKTLLLWLLLLPNALQLTHSARLLQGDSANPNVNQDNQINPNNSVDSEATGIFFGIIAAIIIGCLVLACIVFICVMKCQHSQEH
jgi:hypothetical protein